MFEQIREQEYRHESTNVKLTHPQGRHDDLLWALCLALYGVSLQLREPVSIAEGFSYDQSDPPESQRPFFEVFSSRFQESGNKTTKVRLRKPGEKDWCET